MSLKTSSVSCSFENRTKDSADPRSAYQATRSVFNHMFLSSVSKETTPVWIPRLSSATDNTYFDKSEKDVHAAPITEAENALFKDF